MTLQSTSHSETIAISMHFIFKYVSRTGSSKQTRSKAIPEVDTVIQDTKRSRKSKVAFPNPKVQSIRIPEKS